MESPLLVHCSAGIGRTGTVIAIDHAMRAIDVGEKVDILKIISEVCATGGSEAACPKSVRGAHDLGIRFFRSFLVCQLREDRMAMVQHVIQYKYVYQAAIAYSKQVAEEKDEEGGSSQPWWNMLLHGSQPLAADAFINPCRSAAANRGAGLRLGALARCSAEV